MFVWRVVKDAACLERSADALAQHKPGLTILFGVPVSIEDYLARFDASAAQKSDFLAKFDRQTLAAPARAAEHLRWWRSRYEPRVATPLKQLAEHARRLGFEVRERARLDDLANAAQGEAVVVVVSHWKGPEFSNDDFSPDLETSLAARMDGIDEPIAEMVRNALVPQARKWLQSRRGALNARQALRASLDAPITDFPVSSGAYHELDSTRRSRRRAWLDDQLNDLVRPGLRLELFDGMHSAETVHEALPASFVGGVLDLTVCTSTYLGDRVASLGAHRFRTVQFLELQEFEEAGLRLRYTLDVYAQTELSYLDARVEVGRAYNLAIASVRKGRRRFGGRS